MENRLVIGPEQAGQVLAREALLDRVMGPVRFRRASEKLRAGRQPALNLVAHAGAALVGTVRLWPVEADGLCEAVLLGPLAVDNGLRNLGVGSALMREAVDRAGALGHSAILLVGDAEYYSRFGFSAAAVRDLAMPGPFERHRMLGLALEPGALQTASGVLRPAGRPAETTNRAALAGAA